MRCTDRDRDLCCTAVTYLVVFIERGQRKILVNYAKTSGWQQDLWWSEQSFAAEAEYGWRNYSDFRFIDHLVSGHDY